LLDIAIKKTDILGKVAADVPSGNSFDSLNKPFTAFFIFWEEEQYRECRDYSDSLGIETLFKPNCFFEDGRNIAISYTAPFAKARVKVKKGIQDELLKKTASLDISCFDDIVAALDPVVILISAVPVGVQTILNILRNPAEYKRDMELTRPKRESAYAKGIFYNRQYAQELRMEKLGAIMNRKFDDAMDRRLEVIKKYCPLFVFFDNAFNIAGFGTTARENRR
jgi:hypothetical protein